MAINFPDSPSNGDTTILGGKTYTYDSTSTSWAPATGAASASATVIYTDMAALIAATGMSAGDQALVTALNKVFMYTGTAWYLVATMTNASPTAITGVDGTYTLATDGTATTITAVSTDPEGFPLTWSYAVTTGSIGSTATVSQADNVFTITPSSTEADAGEFSITFSVTDGGTGVVNAVSAFTLAFIVTNSRYTALSVKANATGTNQTFDDASASNHTITVAGNSTASTFSPYRHGGYSLGLDGTNDYITIPQTTDTDLTGDFTVECWVYFNDTAGGSGLMGKWGGSGLFGWTLYATAADFWFYTGNSGSAGTQGAFTFGAPAVNQWYHLAISRTGSTISTYVNGTRTTTITDSNNCTANTTLTVGSDGSSLSSWSVDGYMRDVRIVNGTGLYSGTSFAVPTEPLTAITNTKFLLGNLPYLKDQSTSNHTITINGNASTKPFSLFDNSPYSETSHGASAYFDGTGDYISTANHADFNFGSGNFTIESYVHYTPNPTTNQAIVAQWHTGGGNNRRAFQLRRNYGSTGSFKFYWSTDGSNFPYIESTGINLNTMHNQWIHVAVVRNGNTITMYVNGTDVVNTTLTGSLYDNTTDDIFIGSRSVDPPNIDHQTEGYISDLRVIKGTAIYTSNFTPPAAPLTAITNTKFLLNPETSISDLSQRNALICVGNAATSTTQVKFAGTKSIYIGAQGDYINSIHDSTIPIFPNGDSQDWTLEYWYYPTNIAGFNNIFNIGDGFYMYALNGGLGFYTESGGSYLLGQNQFHFVTENTWSHVAIVRNGNNYNAYVDGVSRFNTTNSNEVQTGTNNLHIGDMTAYNNGALNFYIQDFRITKGLARYTANFTPPTAELEG